MNYAIARAIFRFMDAETAHRFALLALRLGLAGRYDKPDDPVLATRVLGIDFANPVGMAAGFDKDAEVIDRLLALGFGFVEAGTVTPLPQPGNPKPRLFRLDEDNAVINRFGFNSHGLAAYVQRIAARRRVGVFGANVGKNRDAQDAVADYVTGVTAVTPHADYLVTNISSPNTPGLRALQGREQIEELLKRVLEARDRAASGLARKPPLLAKVGPDLTEEAMADIAEIAQRTGVDGLIIGNTTIERPAWLKSRYAPESGGLSGRPLTALSARCLSGMYRLTGGKLPLIGCGGIESGGEAYARIRAGASLIQIYSALVFHGPGLAARIKRELAACLKRDGFKRVADAVGADHR